METRLDKTATDTAPHRTPGASGQPIKQGIRFAVPSLDLMILGLLTIIALVPRVILATQLDMVTDEVVYILGGKIYLPLVRHLSIGASGWNYNYEHPPFVKLLIGLALALNTAIYHPLTELLAARLPSILFGTLLVVGLYWLAKAPFGRVVALLAALCLAFSPWLVYFSALAYLDMTMTALVTIAYLLLWPALRRPWLYPVSAALVGLGAASKYTAVLAIPGMVLFTAYYFLAVRPRLPVEQRPSVPWLWWLAAIVLAPLAFLALDPAIWPNPLSLLQHSFRFEWEHSVNGHLTFLAGQYSTHVPHWAILYIVAAKMSALVTLPALFFAIFALIQLVRFHLRPTITATTETAGRAFVLIWLLAILGMFSLLNIVVGTHYHLPMAPPVALAGACGLATLLRYRRGLLFQRQTIHGTAAGETATSTIPIQQPITGKTRLNPRAALIVVLLAVLLAGPHLFGLTTVYAAEGYTSEFFQSENTVLQVAYPGYRDAVQWLATHTSTPARVGLVALPGTLNAGSNDVSWFSYNSDLPTRLQLAEVHPDDHTFTSDYLVWPMHLVQRGYAIPDAWRAHIVHIVMGGNTIYCYIMAHPPGTA
ncbi:MAG TPA: glycosyltransferase family 39 protein [Ktedonosporobacter sp.]|nr:glycosyltransferase family 39 protein [Ktedonosporobacter sp.]